MEAKIRDVKTLDDLVDTCSQVFGILVSLANSIQSRSIVNDLKTLGKTISETIKDLSSASVDQAATVASLIQEGIISSLIQAFSAIEGASRQGTNRLTHQGAHGLTAFVSELLLGPLPFKVKFTPQFSRTLIVLTYYLTECQSLFNKTSKKFYQFITQQPDFNQETFLKVLEVIEKPSKFTFLSYLHQKNNDQSGLKAVGEQFNSLVMNDKEPTNAERFRYFVPYLSSLDEATFNNIHFPEIEFVLKRGSSMIPLIAETFSALSFKFTPEIVELLTKQIFVDDYMVKEESFECSNQYFGKLASKLVDKEAFTYLLSGFLFDRFIQTRNSSLNAAQRLSFFRHINKVIQSVNNKDLIDQEKLKALTIALVEYWYQHKEEVLLKESFENVISIIRCNQNLAFLNDVMKKQISKASNIWHIYLIAELLDSGFQDLEALVSVVSPHFKQMLNTENFKTTANYSQVLALISYICSAYNYTKDDSYRQYLVNHEALAYLSKPSGFVNTPAFFQKPLTFYDSKSHLKAIELLLISHYSELSLTFGDNQLRDTLCEYLLNEQIVFREHSVLTAIEKASIKGTDQFALNFMKTLQNKIKQISQRPAVYNREEASHKPSQTLANKVRIALKFVLTQKTHDLTQEEFFMLIKIICHPLISKNNKELNSQIKALDKIYANGKLSQYFDWHKKPLIDYSIKERTGILSHDNTLRAQAVNIGVTLASQNLLSAFIDDLAKILNYKPLEMAHKLEKIFVEEFDRISFYDLMYYSEITKDLLNVFNAKDAAIIKKELSIQEGDQTIIQDGAASQSIEEEKGEEPEAAIDPSKLAAMMLKKQAAQKKTQAAAKKPAAKAAPAKAPAKKQPQLPSHKLQEEAPAHQPMDKEKRNKADREQIVNYLHQIQKIKGDQAVAAYEIIKRANLNNLYLDLTLNHLLMPMIKLLNYSATRFATNICLHSLFEGHRLEPLFKVKTEVVSCLNALSSGRIFIKNMREFQQIFHHIEVNTQVQLFDKGYIQMIMMMANFVLKDLSVHLSVKEQALAVVQSILESSNLVENIDLVIVTINMMKSSYNNENLGQYLNLLLRRLNLEQLALILQRIFEYEPVPRNLLMKELLEYELPLCCPVWFSTQLWILQFDEECGKMAKKLWNKYGMVLRSGVIDLSREKETRNFYHYMRSKNTNIFDNTIRGTVSAIEIFQNRYDLVIDDLIEFYNQEMQIIEELSLVATSEAATDSETNILADERVNRIAIAEIIKRTAHLVQASSFKKIFDFFIIKGCLDQNEQVSKACMDAALQVIHVKGSDYSEEILKILEKYINEAKKYSEMSKNQAIIMIGALASYLDNTSQKKLVGTFEKMLEVLNTPSELIRQSVCKVIPQLARFFEDKSKKFLEDHLTILKTTQDEKLLRGSAYAVSGILKGLGMQTFISMDILNLIHKECFAKHSDALRKVSGLYLYETLTISLGKIFEMNVEKILPNIMQCISDPKEQVRRAALNANKTIMSKLSNHAIKTVLPIFLKGLYNDNWRSKLASVEALGNTAFCAPRQIASFLPQIVKGIREVLSDTHEKVHEAALQAIQNIGSVIKCPEIADILETLVKALSNPNVHLKDAMKVLLDTSFVHAIDAPSLSLLIPILDSGLMMHDNESKHLASKLMGNICNLTQDPEDLLPYIKILMPAIKNSLFDSIPEIRASAAKALGSLSKGLGLDNSAEMLGWLHTVLDQKQLHSSERSGAAQGFAEIISVHGTKFFEDTIKFVITKAQDPQPHVRESYRSVLVFLATCFPQFVQYLPKLLPIMIQGLSDDTEDVRKISLRNVKICIKLFGKQAPTQLVTPIMEMMFHKDFRVRQSSSVLMYQLVKELENDVIKSQPKYVSQEVKNEILSSMFILKYDIIERVATQAAQIWKNIIDNQLKVLKSIIDVLVKQIFDIIKSDYLELQEMGLNCMRGICEKFGEKFVSEIIDILEVYMERATTLQQSVGITKAIYNMTFAAPVKLLTDLRVRFLHVIDGNISHENDEIRSLTAKTFNIVFQKTFEPNFMIATLDKQFLKKLHHFIVSAGQGPSREADLLIMTLKEILADQPQELKLEDKLIRICNNAAPALVAQSSGDHGGEHGHHGHHHHAQQVDQGDKKFTIAQARVLTTVATKIGANMFKKRNCIAILDKLLKELTVDDIDDERRLQEVLISFSEIISQSPELEISMINEQIITDFYNKCRQMERLGFYVDFIAYYCQNTKANYEKFAKMYMENVLVLMNDKNEKLVEKVVKSYTSIINGLQKENQFTLIPLIKECIERIAVIPVPMGDHYPLYKKKVQTIKMLEKAEGVKNLSAVIQNSITHGSLDIRINSAICFQYLIDFSKPDAIKTEVIKICGALIRVVNDKFPPELKLQIFLALKLILLRSSLFAKAMAPQLQTTFLKAFNDSQATAQVRKVVVDCLIHFLKIAPKVDPILKELSQMVEGDKLENPAKIEVAEILAIIIRMSGKSVQQAMQTQIQTTLLSILQAKQGQYNDKTIVNCSVALAFLATYASDPAQMLSLFDQYDNLFNLNLSFGLKFGLLLNGSPAITPEIKAKLIPQLEAYCVDMLKDTTGIEEVDGKESEDAEDENDYDGRLHGSLSILGHIGDIFVRRFTTGTSDELYNLQLKVVNQAGVLTKLNSEKNLSKQTFHQVLFYLSSIPVRLQPDKTFNNDLAAVLKQGFEFINNFYLEFNEKHQAQPAVLNMTMLNYDNFLDINDDSKIRELTPELAKEVVNGMECYKSLISEMVRMTAIELVFA